MSHDQKYTKFGQKRFFFLTKSQLCCCNNVLMWLRCDVQASLDATACNGRRSIILPLISLPLGKLHGKSKGVTRGISLTAVRAQW